MVWTYGDLPKENLSTETEGKVVEVQRSGRVVEHWTFGRRDRFKTTCGRVSDFLVEETGVQNHLLSFQNLGNFVHPI